MERSADVDHSLAQAAGSVGMMATMAIGEARSTTIGDHRRLACASLTDMYDRESDLFVFRVRRAGSSIVREGTSARYTAISLIGLAGERAEVVERVLHTIGRDHAAVRGHVSCFADLVYPILALSQHGMTANDTDAISCAARAAEVLCRLQGPAGQWWWHYDYRTGQVIERYPVYAV